MMNGKKGSLTVFFALTMLLFLTFCMVLVEGARICFLRVKAAAAMELAEFSVLSEYQYELLSKYGVFFLDLDYEEGGEQRAVLESRANQYLSKNAEELTTVQLNAEKFRRATDSGGAAFFQQTVELMKVKSGYKLFEKLFDNVGNLTEDKVDLGEILAENENAASGLLGEYVDEEGLPLFNISIPSISFPSIDALTEAVFGNQAGLSPKSVDLGERILHRPLTEGVGTKGNGSFADMQLFHGYLFEYCNYYGAEKADVWKECLEYQLEYIVSGKSSDLENLENVMWRIFLLRAGGNYLFYHQDGEKMAAAKAEAIALVGITGNAVLIEAVKEIILISKAIEDGIVETRRVFAGEKVPLYQAGVFRGIEIGYEEYLYLFLNATNQTEKIYRCMDVIELEVRKKSGYENLCLDHCTDFFEIRWTYQFDSLFHVIPLMNGSTYENTVTRKIYYEK